MICKTIDYAFGYFTIYPKKDENLPIVKDVVNWFQFRYNIKVRIVCSDNEMDCIKIKRWLNSKDIDFERCALDIYEQNGIAETVGKTIMAKVKIIRFLRRFFYIL